VNAAFVNLFLWMLLQPAATTRFQENLRNGQVFESVLSISEKSAETRQTVSYEARLFLAADGYRLEAEGRVYVVSGNESRVFEKTENRLIISEYLEDEDDFAPARYLGGVPDGYTANEQKSKNGATVSFKTSNEALRFKEVQVIFDLAGLPKKLEAKDHWGGQVSISFKNASFSRQTSWKIIEVPANSERIDLRQ
jgi:hypothetical protein